MDAKNKKMETIDDYIMQFPEDIRKKLNEVRAVIHKAAPEALEKISYGIPTFFLDENLIHFGAFKTHIGLYPTPNGLEAFKKELSQFKGAKGSVQFPHNQSLPLDLIRRIVEYRVSEIRKKKYSSQDI